MKGIGVYHDGHYYENYGARIGALVTSSMDEGWRGIIVGYNVPLDSWLIYGYATNDTERKAQLEIVATEAFLLDVIAQSRAGFAYGSQVSTGSSE